MKRKYLLFGVLYLVALGFLSYRLTFAFFKDTATSTNNVFTAAAQFPIRSGDVVINELNWAGSTQGTADEWIELRNTTGNSIDISNWDITKWTTTGTPSEALMLTIPSGKSIAAGGLFLIVDKSPGVGTALTATPDLIDSSVVLDNSNLQVKLYKGTFNSGGVLIDTAGNKSVPLAGVNDRAGNPKSFASMERNSTPGDGTLVANWHTATTAVGLNSDSGQNKGTPGSTND